MTDRRRPSTRPVLLENFAAQYHDHDVPGPMWDSAEGAMMRIKLLVYVRMGKWDSVGLTLFLFFHANGFHFKQDQRLRRKDRFGLCLCLS